MVFWNNFICNESYENFVVEWKNGGQIFMYFLNDDTEKSKF